MTIFTYYDASNINYESSLAFSTIFFDGFQDDLFFNTFHPKLFGHPPRMPALQRAQVFNRICRSWARNTKLEVLQGTKVIVLAIDKEPVAVALYDLPEYQHSKLNMIQKLKYALYYIYVKVMDFLDGYPHKIIANNDYDAFLRGMKQCEPNDGILGTLSRSSMTYEQLMEIPYPVKDTLYLSVLAVKFKYQGRGYGSMLLNESLSKFDLDRPVFRGNATWSIGPAKVSVHPSVGKEYFYEKNGFQTTFRSVGMIGTAKVDHQLMQKLLNRQEV